jgi:uncharacterized membrane protein (DUF373 family)
VFLYRVWREIIALGNFQEGLSNIILVVITIELYRLLAGSLTTSSSPLSSRTSSRTA